MKKSLFLVLLITLVLSASTFLIIESAKYYNTFYKDSYLPLALAILLEGFVLTLATAKVYRLALRVVQKVLMMSVFIIIVATASLYHVNPIIELLSKSDNTEKIESLIKEEISNLKNDSVLFNKQKQKLNTAKSVNRRHDTFRGLLSVVDEKEDVSIALYLDIAVLILIRLVLQTCNLFCASMLGSYYRKGDILFKKKEEYCLCGCGQIVKDGNIYIKGHNTIPGRRVE